MNICDRGPSGIGPRIDGMRFGRMHAGICVFPPELDDVFLVSQHGVLACAFAPGVAADAGVPVVACPRLDGHPCVVFVAAVPGILGKGGVVGGEPDVHALDVVKGLGVVGSGCGGEFSVVCIAVVVAFPTGLQACARRVVRFEVEVTEWTGLPDRGNVILDYLLDGVVAVNVEDVYLFEKLI